MDLQKQKQFHSKYNSLEWKTKSLQIKMRDGFTCQNCLSKKHLHVHHLVYLDTNIWDYPGNYLITLCENCHISEHVSLDYFKSIEFNVDEMLLSGMLAIDIYKKEKAKEQILLDRIPF